MGRKTISNQIHSALADKIAFGKSKHLDKIEQETTFGKSTYKIYSFSTYDTYNKVGREYGKWLADKGVKYGKLTDTEQYAREYIQSRLEDGKSVYTLKMERSALGMIYGHNIEVLLPIRHNGDVKRSREETFNDKHISRTGKYADIFTVATATGCRRCDLKALNTNSLVERDGKYFLDIKQSKGGRDRLAPVLPSKADEVKKIFEQAKENGRGKLFDHIPKEIDVHGLRREYAQELYHSLTDDKSLRDEYLTYYPARHENVKSDFYRDREGNVFERDTVYVVSQSLGHNRIDTSITAYLK